MWTWVFLRQIFDPHEPSFLVFMLYLYPLRVEHVTCFYSTQCGKGERIQHTICILCVQLSLKCEFTLQKSNYKTGCSGFPPVLLQQNSWRLLWMKCRAEMTAQWEERTVSPDVNLWPPWTYCERHTKQFLKRKTSSTSLAAYNITHLLFHSFYEAVM